MSNVTFPRHASPVDDQRRTSRPLWGSSETVKIGGKMRNLAYLVVSAAMLVSAFLVPGTATALPGCTALATDPANGLAGNSFVKSATSVITPPAGPKAANFDV